MAQDEQAADRDDRLVAEARERLRRFAPNRLPEAVRKRFFALLLEVLREPMFLLLVVAAGLYLVLGDPAEGAVLGLFAAVSVGLVVVQEYRSERALDALRAMAAPVARVRRDGVVRTISAAELVPGDWIVLGEGERVPADAGGVNRLGQIDNHRAVLIHQYIKLGQVTMHQPGTQHACHITHD